MSKYFCITCIIKIKNNKQLRCHQKTFNNHHIIQENIKDRILNWLTDNFNVWWRMIGIYILLGVLVNHFKFSFTEVTLLAISLGMLI